MFVGMSDVSISEIFEAEQVEGIGAARTSASVTGLWVSSPSLRAVPSPVSCFCPQSALVRCFMGSDEDRSANLKMRSHRMMLPRS